MIVTDTAWCTDDPDLRVLNPFPFWLYSDSDLEYLGRLFSSRALGRMVRRVQLGLGLRTPSAADGYWDYEQHRSRRIPARAAAGRDRRTRR